MRILCVPDGLPIDYTIQLANALSKSEEVTIVLSDNPQMEEYIENIDAKVNLYIARKAKCPFYHPKNLLIPIEITIKIRQLNPDIIHIQNGDLLLTLSSLFMRKYTLITTI